MPKKIPLRGGEPVRGGDTSMIPQKGCDGNIPASALTALSLELSGLLHGKVTLELHVRDGKLARFTTGRERSFMGDGNGE
jgi:hypothetical protein